MFVRISDTWGDVLKLIPAERRDVYFTEEYVKLYENENYKALCVICSDDTNVLCVPFLKGEIDGLYDMQSAYGYGGPVSNVDDEEWLSKAFDEVNECIREEGYICAFHRLHPLLENNRLISNDKECEVVFDRYTVAVDTLADIEDIWKKQISSKNRNMIRKAQKYGLEFKMEEKFESLDAFVRLYEDTMHKVAADSFYFFNQEYYKKLIYGLTGKSALGIVKMDGKVISAAIFLFDDIYGHYHLSGSDKEFVYTGCNNFLLWNAICFAHDKGLTKLHLGGGTSDDERDSLLLFKKGFSKKFESFNIAKKIYDCNRYDEICRIWEENNSDKIPVYGDRVLKYRF